MTDQEQKEMNTDKAEIAYLTMMLQSLYDNSVPISSYGYNSILICALEAKINTNKSGHNE